jgi:type IV pilus assembly protein PilB
VAQRLIRKLCSKCKKKEVNFDSTIMEAAGIKMDDWKNIDLYRAVGCDECNNTGYKGRMAIHEALYFTKEIRQIIVRSGEDVDEEGVSSSEERWHIKFARLRS